MLKDTDVLAVVFCYSFLLLSLVFYAEVVNYETALPIAIGCIPGTIYLIKVFIDYIKDTIDFVRPLYKSLLHTSKETEDASK